MYSFSLVIIGYFFKTTISQPQNVIKYTHAYALIIFQIIVQINVSLVGHSGCLGGKSMRFGHAIQVVILERGYKISVFQFVPHNL